MADIARLQAALLGKQVEHEPAPGAEDTFRVENVSGGLLSFATVDQRSGAIRHIDLELGGFTVLPRAELAAAIERSPSLLDERLIRVPGYQADDANYVAKPDVFFDSLTADTVAAQIEAITHAPTLYRLFQALEAKRFSPDKDTDGAPVLKDAPLSPILMAAEQLIVRRIETLTGVRVLLDA